MVELIHTDNAPNPNGHYSQASVVGNLIFVSAQLPSAQHSSIEQGRAENFEWEVHSVLENILTIVKAGGGNLGSIASVRFFTTSEDNWPKINKVFSEFMGNHKPARAVVNVIGIKSGFSVMAEAIAEKNSQ